MSWRSKSTSYTTRYTPALSRCISSAPDSFSDCRGNGSSRRDSILCMMLGTRLALMRRMSRSADALNSRRKEAIPSQPALQLVQADRGLIATLSHNCQVMQGFQQSLIVLHLKNDRSLLPTLIYDVSLFRLSHRRSSVASLSLFPNRSGSAATGSPIQARTCI